MKTDRPAIEGILALPGFPLVLVTVGRNIMTAAAFSFYSFDPPCVMVGIRPENLTCTLIAQRREYGVNLPSWQQVEAARVCGSVSGREADKFVRAGLTPQPGTAIQSVLIAECPVNIECRVVHQVEFGGSHRWFVGQIEAVQIDEAYTRDQALLYWPREFRTVGPVVFPRGE